MSTWLFQGNPRYFDIDGYLMEENPVLWSAQQNREQMAVGDTVYFWRSDAGVEESGGLIARGVIVTAPQMLADTGARQYYVENPADANIQDWRVQIQIGSKHLDPPVLTRRQLASDAALQDMLILRVAVMTNYTLQAGEVNRLNELYERAERAPRQR